MLDIESIAWAVTEHQAKPTAQQKVHFATGDVSLVQAKGFRFERVAAASQENPHGLWIMR
ncbi:MAG: hypothetical protein RL318_1363 [Fibrobacterota bacterium]|jgi:hypothetical protein